MFDKPDRLPIVSPTFDPKNLKAHPIAADFPMMEGPEYEGFKASIKERGILEPITLYGTPPMILDGRNRQRAALEVGHTFTAKDFVTFTGNHDEAAAFSNAKNAHRRHLTAAQKEDRVKRYVAQHPNASNREVSRLFGVSHTTVAKYKEVPGEKDYARFRSTFDDLSDEHRARFARDCGPDLRALLAGQCGH